MKKYYPLLLISLFFSTQKLFAQTFTYLQTDTIEYGAPGTEIICSAELRNATTSTISMRVTRIADVMGAAPNWTSAFCMDLCYPPTVDSILFSFDPDTVVYFTFHFYTDTIPDSATAVMRWRNTAMPSNTFIQRFYGITQNGFGVNNISENTARVNIYPMPIVSGSVFSMNISNIKSTGNTLSLLVYDIYGNLVSEIGRVVPGINFMQLDLSAGVYSYALIAGGAKINSGKLIIVR